MRYYDRFLDFCGTVSGILILLVTVGIGIDVAFRAVQGQGIFWLIDLVEYALLAITFLGAPWVLRYGGHVAVDIVLMTVPLTVRNWITRVMALICAVICGIIAIVGLFTVLEAYGRGTLIFKSLVFPEWWILLFMPISMLLCGIEFLRQVVMGRARAAGLSGSEGSHS